MNAKLQFERPISKDPVIPESQTQLTLLKSGMFQVHSTINALTTILTFSSSAYLYCAKKQMTTISNSTILDQLLI